MMANIADVLTMLIPNGGYIASGDDYEGIQFVECEPITKAKFTAGFAQWDAWKANEDAKAQAAEDAAQAKLQALGLTTDDLKALGL
jgi:hypothetical protein